MYRLIGRLETGDLSELYRAQLEPDGSPVVVKLFHLKTTDADYARAIAHTANQLRRVTHAGVAHVQRVGLARQRLAIVRDDFGRYTAGEALTRLNTREVLLPSGVALSMVIELLDVLQAAHEAGVVHGALTPGNVLLSSEGYVGLADFGALAALQASPKLKHAFSGKGRGAYRAPELGNTDEATVQSDVYAVGALAYELLTLREASSGNTALPTRREKLAAPSRVVRSLNSRIDSLVMRALEVEPSRRFRSCAELALALREFLIGHGGVPSRQSRQSFVDALFPKDSVMTGLGPVPFTTFEIEDVSQVVELDEGLSEVEVRPGYSRAAEPAAQEVAVVETSWEAPPSAEPLPGTRTDLKLLELAPAATSTLVELVQAVLPPDTIEMPHATMVDVPVARALEPVGRRMSASAFGAGAMAAFIALLFTVYLLTKPVACYQAAVNAAAFLQLNGVQSGAARVEIDGAPVCSSISARLALHPGSHRIRITGFKKVFETTEEFTAGHTQTISPVFQ